MSIEFRNATFRTRNTIAPVVLSNLTLRIEASDRFALLAPLKSSLDLIVEAICGARPPEAGRVVRTSSISWPLPSPVFLHKHLSFVANARFIAQLYGADQDDFIDRVLEVAMVRELAERRIDHCPGKGASRFAFAVGACLPFDTYLLTSTSIGDKEDRPKYAEMIADLSRRNGLILATTSGKVAAEYCDRALVLDPAGVACYDDIEAALEHFERISKRAEEADELDFFGEDEPATAFDDF